MKITKTFFFIRPFIFFILMIGISMANNTQVPVHYQMNFRVNNMGCEAKLNGIYLVHSGELMRGVPKSLSFTQPIGNFVDEDLNILTLEVHNISSMVSDPEKGYCDMNIVAMIKNPNTGEVETREISHVRYIYIENENSDNQSERWVLSKQESRIDQDEGLANLFIQTEKLDSYFLKDKRELQRELATREFTVHHSQPFSWIHKSMPFEDTPENKQKLWDKYEALKSVIEYRNRGAFRRFVEPGNTDIAQHQGEDPEQHFAIIFDQLIQPYFDLNKDIWEPMYLKIDDFDLEIYAGGKLFRLNEKRKTLYSPIQWRNHYQKQYRSYNPLFTFIDGEIVMATF